jgi:glycosyltransferase
MNHYYVENDSKMNMLKISIITICFNNAKEIVNTIESVINQTYTNVEYIIVDGGSTDGTLEILKIYKKYIKKIISESDENLYDAINKGLKLASGDIVGLIHAGDKLYDFKVIEKIAGLFKSNDIDIMYGHSIIVNSKNKPVRINISPEYRKEIIRRGWMPSHQSIYVKSNIIKEYGYYNLDLHPYSDYEFFLRYFYFNQLRIKRLDEFIVCFSTGGISTNNYFGKLWKQKLQKECWYINGEPPPRLFILMKILRKFEQFALAGKYRITQMKF